jgi:ribonuclease I
MLVRPLRHGRPVFIPLVVLAAALLAGCDARPDARASTPRSGIGWAENRGQKQPFDFYLLALTSHPAFCADGHARTRECDTPGRRPISIHGLWPERLEPGRYPRDCAGPPLDLRPDTVARLAELMPGMIDGLHEHEWRAHGTCTGLDDDIYFGHLYVLSLHVDAALSGPLTTLSGGRTSAAELRRYADAYETGMGATLTFHCRTLRDAPREHRREPYLVEIRQCFDSTGPGGRPGLRMDCAAVNRRDQGCGSGFRIAGAR